MMQLARFHIFSSFIATDPTKEGGKRRCARLVRRSCQDMCLRYWSRLCDWCEWPTHRDSARAVVASFAPSEPRTVVRRERGNCVTGNGMTRDQLVPHERCYGTQTLSHDAVVRKVGACEKRTSTGSSEGGGGEWVGRCDHSAVSRFGPAANKGSYILLARRPGCGRCCL